MALCSNITVAAGASCTANASIDAGSSDPDAGDLITLSQSPPGPYSLGSTLVTLTVTDNHGASNTCSATVTVVDLTPPSVTCPGATTNSAHANCEAAIPNVLPDVTASDNCSAVSKTQNPLAGTFVGLGTHSITGIVVDAHGNTNTCTTTFTVVDDTPPTITCSSNLVVNAAAGQCSAVVNFPAPVVGDNCAGATGNCVPPSGSTLPVGISNVVCTATDGSGNSTQCAFQVAVRACTDIAYTGDTDVLTAGPKISSAPVRLSAQLTPSVICAGNSITNARVCFYLFKSSNLGNTPDLTVCNVPVNPSSNATAVVSLAADTWTVKVKIDPSNLHWYECAVEMAVVNVALGSNDKRTTGGVWVPDTRARNGKLNAGWTVNYHKNGNPKGQWVSVLKALDGYNYQFKSTSWQGGGLAFFSDPSKAAFSGRCVIQKIDPATGNVVDSLGAGNCTFTADVVDGDWLKPKQPDQYGIRILISGSVPAFWLDIADAGTIYPPITLGGGNVSVKSK